MKLQHLSLFLTLLLLTTNIIAQTTEVKHKNHSSSSYESELFEQPYSETDKRKRMKAFNENTYTLKLDSLVLMDSLDINSTKCEYMFDNYGNQTLMHKYIWDRSNNVWINYYKYELGYDDNSNELFRAEYNWKTSENKWLGANKYEYAYDNQNNKILSISYEWNRISNDWIARSKYEYNYDNDNNQIQRIISYWDEINRVWSLNSKIDFSYNSFGLKSSYISYYWNRTLNTWVKNAKNEYSYNSKGSLTSEVKYVGETDETSVGDYRIENTYDNNNNKILYVIFHWNKATNNWKEFYKYEYTYDNNNLLIMQNQYSRVNSVDMWIADFKSEFYYDNNENLTSKTIQVWDVMTSTWINSYRYLYTYDNDYVVSDIYPVNYLNNFISITTTKNNISVDAKMYNWDLNKKQWETRYNKIEHRYYSPMSLTNLIEPSDNAIKVFPNPVVNTLQISNVEGEIYVKVYDLNGILLLQTTQKTIDFSIYKSGLYLLDINGQMIKIVKK